MVNDLASWRSCAAPNLQAVSGRFARIEPARFPEDAAALFAAVGGPGNDDLWRYIPFGPFDSAGEMSVVMAIAIEEQNWRTHLLRGAKTGAVLGMASYMRIRPDHGSAEIGCIVFSKKMQRTPLATEAMYLMARHIFDDLGYRRYEWKCDNNNIASKRAAERLGFQFEGVFRNDMVVKGANRDTAWFSITDSEWPQVRAGFEAWLAPENFDGDGRQRRPLEALRAGC